MTKKLLSLMLVVCIAMSFGIVPVSAGAPIVLDGTTQVMFDQDFSGLSGASDLSDFNVSGSYWVYAPDYMIINGNKSGSILTKNNMEVSDAKSWEFTSSQWSNINSTFWYLGFDGTNGYILRYRQTNKTISLYKDSTISAINDGATPVATITDSNYNYYDAPYVITVAYDNGKFTVYVQTSAKNKAAVLEYTEPTKTAINGKWGIYSGTKNLSVFHMTLKKTYDSVTVEQWKYDKTFTAANTQAELEADGFTFSATTTPSASGLNFKNKTFTFGPDGKDISGDYYFETQLSRKQNYYTFDFNQSADGYYRIEYGRNHTDDTYDKLWVRLYKYDAVAEKTHTLVHIDKPSPAAGHTRIYKGTVKTLEDGSVDINVDIYNGTTLEHTLAYTDTADDVDTGAPLTCGKLRLKSEYSGDSYMKYLKVYSLMGGDGQGETVTYTENVIDKTFSTADTNDIVTAEGFKVGTVSQYSDDYGMQFSSKGTNTRYFYYDEKIEGTYTFYSELYKTTNGQEIYFNRKDENNYYALKYYYKEKGSSSNHYKLVKKINGGSEIVLDSKDLTVAADMGYKCWMKVTISVTEDADTGALTINTTTQSGTRDAITMTYTDTESPLSSGYCRVAYNYTGTTAGCKVFRITKYITETSTVSQEPMFEGRFSNDTGAINAIAKGNIYFEYPTAMLGKYTVVATLYEDNKMTELKTFKSIDIYTGKVKLFDTTNSTAKDMKVRVYFFDSGETLNIVADEVYELR